MGGLSRRNSTIQALRAEGEVTVVDVGGSLLKNGSLRGADKGQSLGKARLIAQGLAVGGLDAMVLSSSDWQLGRAEIIEYVNAYELPVLAANLRCGEEKPFPGFKVLERSGHRLGLVGITAGNIEGCAVLNPVDSLRRAVEEMGDVDVVVGLFPLKSNELGAFESEKLGIDILLHPGGSRASGVPTHASGYLPFSVNPRGKYLGQLDLQWMPGGQGWFSSESFRDQERVIARADKRIKTLEKRLSLARDTAEEDRLMRILERNKQQREAAGAILAKLTSEQTSASHTATVKQLPLGATVPDHPETERLVQALLTSFVADEMGAGAELLVARVAPHESTFAGSDVCATCHLQEAAQWETTRHAKAMLSLVAENHHADRSCVGCHSTGYGATGGPSSPAEIGGLRDVQCEACHGPAKAHARDPSSQKPTRVPNERTCVYCHDGKRDEGRFDLESYWPKIVHDDMFVQPK